MSGSANLYAPPKARVEDVSEFAGDAEEIRREHINREAEIRAIGILYYLGGGLVCLAAIAILMGSTRFPSPRPLPAGVMGAILLVAGALPLVVGRGLRTLRPWARITAIVLAILGLLRPPAGTLVNIYILYLLFSAKGKRIFESDYPEIVAATPHIKYKMSVVIWILLGILVLLLAVFALLALFAALRHH
jgi:hypothetical protein